MRSVFILLFIFFQAGAFAQQPAAVIFTKDSLLIIKSNPAKGFNNNYILFIPKGTPQNKKLFLLVEPNNTGLLNDSMEVHTRHAIALASVSSVGNNVATELKIPLLVPIFPRPASKPLVYTHALDRDVMLEKSPELKRPDLQLLKMIEDAQKVLADMQIITHPGIFMNGFSASGSFTNRFSLLHPEKIKALAIGGFNGELMLPQNKLNGTALNYPLGTNDFKQVAGKSFSLQAYKTIPQFIYMGRLDDNDAVQFDDAYSESERKIINDNIGRQVQERYVQCQKIYKAHDINAVFSSYENVGHWTTSAINLEVVKFFLSRMQQQ